MNSSSESPGFIRNKVVLIISPQPWGSIWISKHHYALECARHARAVYFLNPPDSSLESCVRIDAVSEAANIHVISYRPLFPFIIRFHARWLFNWLMTLQIRRIRRQIGTPVDVVWCFDFNLFSDLGKWRSATRIFHPVDPLNYEYQATPGRSADLVLTVSDSILKHFKHQATRSERLDHGVARCFLAEAEANDDPRNAKTLSFGYVGNLVRGPVDRKVFRELISTHRGIRFVFWGPHTVSEGGRAEREAEEFVNELKGAENVELRGLKRPESLAREMRDMDGFLLCYRADLEYDCSNAHKILEYMSTGKVLVSGPIATYAGRDDLIRMPKQPADFVRMFDETVANISRYNSPELQEQRRALAAANSYARNLERIDAMLGVEKN